MLNPEPGGGHIFAGELNASNFLTRPRRAAKRPGRNRLKSRLDALLSEGPLADERHAETAPPIHGAPSSSRDSPAAARELMRIHSALFPPVRAVAAGVAVQTHGLGGIGKTELAARYVSDFAIAILPACCGSTWPLGSRRSPPPKPMPTPPGCALDAALANAPALWRELALDAKGKPRPASEVRENLARHFDNAKPALVVLDNLPELSPIDARRRILDFLAAPGPQGKTLVTTRDARPVDGYAPLPLTVLGPTTPCACSPATGPRKPRPSARRWRPGRRGRRSHPGAGPARRTLSGGRRGAIRARSSTCANRVTCRASRPSRPACATNSVTRPVASSPL